MAHLLCTGTSLHQRQEVWLSIQLQSGGLIKCSADFRSSRLRYTECAVPRDVPAYSVMETTTVERVVCQFQRAEVGGGECRAPCMGTLRVAPGRLM